MSSGICWQEIYLHDYYSSNNHGLVAAVQSNRLL